MSLPSHLLEPHRVQVRTVRVEGASHRERGLARGRMLAGQIRETSAGYARLFARKGIAADERRAAAMASLDALAEWHPGLHEESLGIAEGAGLELVELGTTLARTEILTLTPDPPSECSTVTYQQPGASVSAQTWDWYAAFATSWHRQEVAPLAGEHAHRGFTEYGMPGKIGLNAAGVGVHLNILRHRDDRAGGVPVHAVLARVLAEAGTVAEAVEMIRSAPLSSSSLLTVVGADEVVMVEVAAGRTALLQRDGWSVHTNHFLAPELQDGAMLTDPASTTHERLAYLDEGAGSAPAPGEAGDLLPMLCSAPDRNCVARLPDPTQPPEDRIATLATVVIDPARGQVEVTPGIPQHAPA
ncbi:C45 family autoproteolytic acyltransferase/hydolase [Ornithinimicrobium pratense]|uniref:Isopenicillin acyltransferase n=1 Tax=Ornithinimicrobium pratense TaxID=2593973 RepID=A0A5J6V3I4_9MICO|nr:C45 family peptidase [Ornithinimicrobium pratense]QFG68275.1 isopenicillin acyltransferase [Ornithinimicrobium pratense]